MSEKLHERVSGFLRILLEDPMPGVLEHNGGQLCGDQYQLVS